jgi:hypothetical protein
MKQRIENKTGVSKSVFKQFAVNKNKAVFAFCLLGVMVFMWVRMLSKTEPQASKAAAVAQQLSQGQLPNNQTLSRISFIELPRLVGRNDMLTRDFFASDGWRAFTGAKNRTSTREVDVFSKEADEEVIKAIAAGLNLQAIELGENPQAFINNKLLCVGDKLIINSQSGGYQCYVVGIQSGKVFIKCGDAEITLKLTQETGFVDN